MSVWGWLTQSMGLLGRPVKITNAQRRFGSALEYVAIQIEHDGNYDPTFNQGDEEVLLFTDHQIKEARERALANPEDIEKFLKDYAARNALD